MMNPEPSPEAGPTKHRFAAGAAPRAESSVAAPNASTGGEKSDRVSDASEQSFPASDPPAWISMRLGAPVSRDEDTREA